MSLLGIKKATIFVARHGECEGNSSGSFLNPFTDPLTEVGKAQAERLGSHLKCMPLTCAYSSDYLRAKQTTQIILSELGEPSLTNLVYDKRLRERDSTGTVGEIQPVTESEIPFVHVEMENFEARIISFFSELVSTCIHRDSPLDSNILIVSHRLTIQSLMKLLNSSRSHEFGIEKWTVDPFSEKPMKNTSYHKIVLEIESQQQQGHQSESKVLTVCGRVETAHCRDHLDTNM